MHWHFSPYNRKYYLYRLYILKKIMISIFFWSVSHFCRKITFCFMTKRKQTSKWLNYSRRVPWIHAYHLDANDTFMILNLKVSLRLYIWAFFSKGSTFMKIYKASWEADTLNNNSKKSIFLYYGRFKLANLLFFEFFALEVYPQKLENMQFCVNTSQISGLKGTQSKIHANVISYPYF